MANFTTTADLKLGALDRAGELTNGKSDFDSLALENINHLYRSILAGSNEYKVDLGEYWEWAKSQYPKILELQPAIDTGTVAVTKGSTSATLSAAATPSVKDRYLKVENNPDFFRIDAHTAGGTALTLDANYTNDTETVANYKIIQFDYDLADNIMRLTDAMTVYRQQPFGSDLDYGIEGIDKKTFRAAHPFFLAREEIPRRFTLISESEGEFRVRFNAYVDRITRVEYDFIPIPNKLTTFTFVDGDVSAVNDTITETNHGLQNGEIIQLTSTGTLPAGLSADLDYYIIERAANTFKVALTRGGSVVDITAAAGGGTHTCSNLAVIPLQHRKVLMYGAAHMLLVDKSDSKADHYFRLTQALLQALVTDNRRVKQHIAKNRGRLVARQDLSKRTLFARRLVRGS